MVSGINANNTLNWFALLATQKNSSANSSQKTGGSSGDTDTAELSLMVSGQGNQRQDPLEQLVNDGTITSDQASAIGQALQSAWQSGQTPGSGSDPLASLVSAGTITQDQANSVKSAFQAARPDQGQNSFMSNVLSNLVSSGTITQDQADSVQQALAQAHHGHHHGGAHGAGGASASGQAQSASSSSGSDSTTDLSGMTEEQILQLLASGQITTQQAQNALQQLESEDSSGTASQSVSASQTSETRRDPLASLVANGTITQDQESAIQTAFRQAMDTNRAINAYTQGAAAV